MADHEQFLESVDATEALGARLAASLQPGDSVWLAGPLGAGKTALTRGLLRALGHAGAVKSPTYTLVENYSLDGQRLHHFDLYRIVDPEELEYLGLDDYFDGNGICLVEWPERDAGLLPTPTLQIQLSYQGEHGEHRKARVSGPDRILDFLFKSN